VQEFGNEQAVDNPCPGTVSDAAGDHGGFSPKGKLYPVARNPSPDMRTFIFLCMHLSMVITAMKIIGINASPKGEKSQTRRLVMGVLEGARQAGADVTFIDLCSLDIAYCTACGTCYAKGECIHDDDFPMLYRKMVDADGIVLGSPNYINQVTAQMKTMLDRMADGIHCQEFTGKYACAVSTAGGSLAEDVAAYLNSAMFMLGAMTVGTAGVNFLGNPDVIIPAEKEAKDLGRKLVDAIRTHWKDPAQEKALAERKEYMKRLVQANRDLWKHEYDYWKGLGELK
jgi:multimeric flavodoxin WrbA